MVYANKKTPTNSEKGDSKRSRDNIEFGVKAVIVSLEANPLIFSSTTCLDVVQPHDLLNRELVGD